MASRWRAFVGVVKGEDPPKPKKEDAAFVRALEKAGRQDLAQKAENGRGFVGRDLKAAEKIATKAGLNPPFR